MRMLWYALLTTPGHENKVKTDIMQRLANAGRSSHVREIAVPTQQVTEVRDGKKVVKEQRILPGYLLVQCALPLVHSDLKATKGVRGFAGPGGEPSALMQIEVDRMLGRGAKGAVAKKSAPAFEVGETVRITEGPLADFSGEISEVDNKADKLTVLVPIFGRTTPAEVSFAHVRKD